jgi:hypothetical protein
MDITALPLAPLGATSILAIAIIMLLRGALIPRSVHEDRMADKDQTIEYLKAANEQLVNQNRALMTVGHTAERVLLSIHEAAGGKDEEERSEVASS